MRLSLSLSETGVTAADMTIAANVELLRLRAARDALK